MSDENKTLIILFADISGSTSLYETLGDEKAHRLVSNCISILSDIINQHQGVIIKTIGDEVMCTFESAEKAVNAAISMHKALDSMQPADPEYGNPNIRVGLHIGQVIRKGNDVFGDAVNVAARMVSLAKPRQIIATEQIVRELKEDSHIMVKCIDKTTLKGKGGEFTIYEIIWEEQNLTIMLSKDMVAHIHDCHLRLQLADKVVMVDNNHPAVTLGRQAQNDLMVNDASASRVHVKVEYNHGKFVLIDKSTNGTYVNVDGKKPAFVHNDELVLTGCGIISLGREVNPSSLELIYFKCEI